jgi:hypothetical protein
MVIITTSEGRQVANVDISAGVKTHCSPAPAGRGPLSLLIQPADDVTDQ